MERPPPYSPMTKDGFHEPPSPGFCNPVPSAPQTLPHPPVVIQPSAQIINMAPPQQSNVNVTVNTGRRIGTGCPVCYNNSWTGTYSCCAWLLCIFCFPCGLICCCCMRKKKCSKCGFTTG